MGNHAIGYRNRIDQATLSGPGWRAAQPLTNIQIRDRLHAVARTIDLTDTYIDIDLGSALAVQAISVHNQNLSSVGTWRATGGSSVGGVEGYNGTIRGVVQIDPVVDILEWEDVGWWEGDGERWRRNKKMLSLVLPTMVTARFWRIYLSDATNPDGHLQLGRIYIGPLMISAHNDSWPRVSGSMDFNTFDRNAGGIRFVEPGLRAKKVELTCADMTDAETRIWNSINERDGSNEDVLYLPDVDNAGLQQEFGFLGTVESGLDAIRATWIDRNSATITLVERI